jgi:hypothetical protein
VARVELLSPAPVSKMISGRSGDSESKSSVASDFEILNIEAVTTEEEGKTDTNDQEGIDSSASTVTEDKNPAPVGSQASQGPNSSDSEDDGWSTSESDSDSDSDSDISSKCSDSTSDSIHSDSSIATTKMSSTLKSPVCDGSRESFEEWHSQWEVYAGDNKIDEYISVVFHPDLPLEGHAKLSPTKEDRKALKKNQKAIASLRVSFATTYSVDAMIEASIDDNVPVKWPYGRIDLVLIDLMIQVLSSSTGSKEEEDNKRISGNQR